MPHVYAKTTFGLFHGYGYVVAQDRLFQMEMARRSTQGRVAEVLGPKFVAFDKGIRANYWPQSIHDQIAALPRADRDILEGYAAGMNAWLARVKADPGRLMPKQFNDLGFAPEPWTAFDVVMVFVGTMANRFSDFNTEIDNLGLLTALTDKHGAAAGQAIFDELKWVIDPDAPTTVPESAGRYTVPVSTAAPSPTRCRIIATRRRAWPGWPGTSTAPCSAAQEAQQEALLAQLEAFGMTGQAGFPAASNIWIVGKRAAGASSILLNGPQFGWFAPAYTFGIGLHGELRHRRQHPLRLPLHPVRPQRQDRLGRDGGLWRWRGHLRREARPGRPDPLPPQGRMEADGNAQRDHRGRAQRPRRSRSIAPCMAWSSRATRRPAWPTPRRAPGAAASSTRCSAGCARARPPTGRAGWAEAERNALTINWYYADRRGNIGYVHTGKYPERRAGHDLRLPVPGTGEMDWKGLLPFRSNPQVSQPRHRLSQNWNNSPMKGYPNPDMLWLSGAAQTVSTSSSSVWPRSRGWMRTPCGPC
jgi:penicillin amidase